ncbi:MAG TPA: ABC transporter permease subunit, partial [Planctomycetota bacterium]|nr:ABC transporter permease subunit [Planctomycetota bacterium]
MSLRMLRSPMPLLAKELTEQAARKRTYVLRVIYAALLFLIFAMMMVERLRWAGRDPYAVLGCGGHLFQVLVVLQFTGIFIFLPGMMSSVITSEKERDSLALLLLTDLGPWEILLQKYLGRLIPMFTFLLLSLPLLATAYAFGGITRDDITSSVYLLFLCALQVGALSVAISAWSRTTTGAFLGSYLMGGAFYLIAPLAVFLVAISTHNFRGAEEAWENSWVLFPPYLLFGTRPLTFEAVLGRSIPILVSIGVFLILARTFIRRRAFLAPKNRLLSIFRRQDRFWHRLNRFVGGVVLVREKQQLPGDDPVQWRELTKRPLGQFSHLIRLILIIEIPLVMLASIMLVTAEHGSRSEEMSVILMFLWGIAALVVTVKSAGALSGERTQQTLEILLTTPLASADIVKQKMSGSRRMILVMLVPFLTVFALQAWISRGMRLSPYYGYGYRYREELGPLSYLVFSTATVLVYLFLFGWFANWIALRSRTRARAIVGTLIGLVLWLFLPIFAVGLVAVFTDTNPSRGLSWLMLLSPMFIVPVLEFGSAGIFRFGGEDVPTMVPAMV